MSSIYLLNLQLLLQLFVPPGIHLELASRIKCYKGMCLCSFTVEAPSLHSIHIHNSTLDASHYVNTVLSAMAVADLELFEMGKPGNALSEHTYNIYIELLIL